MSREYWYVNISTGGGFSNNNKFWADGWESYCYGRLIQFYQKPNETKIPVAYFAVERINCMKVIEPPEPIAVSKPKPKPSPAPWKAKPIDPEPDRTEISNPLTRIKNFVVKNW